MRSSAWTVAATAGATAATAAVGSRLQLSLHFSPPLNNIHSNRPSSSTHQNTNFQPPDRRSESHSRTPAGPMLVPVIFVMKDKHVHFEEPVANPQPQQPHQSNSLPKTGGECSATQWCDVRRDHKGRKVIVAHKSPCYGNGPAANGGDGKGGTEDVKKGANGNGNGDKAKEGEKKGDDKKGDVKADGAGNGGGENGGGDEKFSARLAALRSIHPLTPSQKPHELTPEEDEKLIALKAENKSWKEIVAEMGKPKGVLTQRWKVIDPAKADGDGDAAAKTGGGNGDKKNGNSGDKKEDDKSAAAAEEKKDEEPKKMTKAEKKAAKAAAAKAEAEEAKAMEQAKSSPPSLRSAGKAGSKARSKADDSEDGWLTLQEDSKWAFMELQLLAELLARYGFLWELVAAKFYDITGRRVYGYEVREKFGFPA